jgi:hypothetical protein
VTDRKEENSSAAQLNGGLVWALEYQLTKIRLRGSTSLTVVDRLCLILHWME